ncbi:MAG: NAD-dependent dehydratase [Chthonomonadales bacterium]|nr:NAD-dependent dehydratase [Chthonomonadales bacterium]
MGNHNLDIGVVEWFRVGEYDRVDRVLTDLKTLGMNRLRTGVSWADWHTPSGAEWYRWLLPRLAEAGIDILPCFLYTPPSLGVEPKTSAPPREPKAFADFLDQFITELGDCFDWVELWNEPNNRREWDFALDPQWLTFCTMVGGAAYWAQQRGKKVALGGPSPADPHWVRLMCERGVMAHIDALGIHGFPATFDFHWPGWEPTLQSMRTVLDGFGLHPELWITEAGYSTWRQDEPKQVQAFLEALDAPADHLYWYAAHDLNPALPTLDGSYSDEREYHFGLRRADGAPKLLYRLWEEGGIAAVRDTAALMEPVRREGGTAYNPRPRPAEPYTLITGGAGFIGCNLADRLLREGKRVLALDNLARSGVERNLHWLRKTHGDRYQLLAADVRDVQAVASAVQGAEAVFHFAAQVAVTTSLDCPTHDFDVNARGTLVLLEALRALASPPPLLFTSTNKVYGGLEDLRLRLAGTRYEPEDAWTRGAGVSELRPLDFHSPYGCSKGAADQYVRDYARTYDLPAAVFRMSCIYGRHQCGNEDQGWVAHFLLRALRGEPITLYGDGRQVRDVLFADDLVEALLLARDGVMRGPLRGEAFNIGGGPTNTISLLELLDRIAELDGRRPRICFEDWRPGDQRYYVSDTCRFRKATGWQPRVGASEGVETLYHWLREHVVEAEAGPLLPAGSLLTEVAR